MRDRRAAAQRQALAVRLVHGSDGAMNWLEFWNQDTSLYVNERHRRAHYDLVARDLLRHVPPASARLVDYGCGDTLTAERLAAVCAHLFLCDAAPRVRDRLRKRYAGQPSITVITPEQFQQLPAHSIGMIVVNSVVQYLSHAQLAELIEAAREKLTSQGVLLLADIVPRGVGPWRDAIELIKFAIGNGFLIAALLGLARSYFSPYRKIREHAGFLQFDEAEFLSLLRERGFAAWRQRPNIGHNAIRMTFLAVAP
jgi:SAM-dependent methyltransferase